MSRKLSGNLAALFTSCVWATTVVATKLLLTVLSPIELLVVRFLIACIVLFCVFPKGLKMPLRDHLLTAAAGFTGVFFYYILENYSLTYTQAANVSVILSAIPFLTALISRIFLKRRGLLTPAFVVGFLLAALGIGLMSFSGVRDLHLNPLGDLLALGCATVWTIYSLITEKLFAKGYPTGPLTRQMFLCGTVFALPSLLFCDTATLLPRLWDAKVILALLYLGIVASAVCFLTWNYAIDRIGPVSTGLYLYLEPVITIAVSVLVLSERVTLQSGIGILLTLAGLLLSKWRSFFPKEP